MPLSRFCSKKSSGFRKDNENITCDQAYRLTEEFKNRKKHDAEEKDRLKHERDIEMSLVKKTH